MVDFGNMTKEQIDTFLENDKKYADLQGAQAEYIRNRMANEKAAAEAAKKSTIAITIGTIVLVAILPVCYLTNELIEKIKERRTKKNKATFAEYAKVIDDALKDEDK